MAKLINLFTPYLTAMWHWRKSAIVVAWLVCGLGWLVTVILPDRYTVTARIVVDTETILGPLMQDIAVTPDFDRQVKMIRETLFSVPNIVELIDRTGIDREKNVETDREMADLIDKLSRYVQLNVDSKNLFTIVYTDPNPDMAYRVVSEMMDIFVQKNLGHSQRDVEKASKFIDQQIDIYDKKLRTADLKVAEFRREHADELGGAERATRELESAEAEFRRLRAELDAAIWRRDQLKVKLDGTPSTLSVAESQDAASNGPSYLDELSEELSRKLLLYTEQHPDVLALRQLIASAAERQKLADQSTEVYGAVSNPAYEQLVGQLEIAEVAVDDLNRRYLLTEEEVATLTERVKQLPQAEADLKRLTRDYDVLFAQYEQLIERREATQLATDLDTGRQRAEFRIVDPPVRPLEPSGPLHSLMFIGTLFLAVSAGCGYAILRFLLSGTVMTAGQLRSAFLKIPVLGCISIARRPGTYVRAVISHVSLASGAATLVLACAALVYLYEFSTIDVREVLVSNYNHMEALAVSKYGSYGW